MNIKPTSKLKSHIMYTVMNTQELTIISKNSLEYAEMIQRGITEIFCGTKRECERFVDELKQELIY